jgi:2-keto-4-pentenoate hydratase
MTTSPQTSISSAAVRDAADRLLEAGRSGVPCAPVRDLIGSDDISVAYAVQQCLTTARLDGGHRVVGRKIGLTSAAVQRQLGVDQPDFGVLFEDMGVGEHVPPGRLLQPKAEAEIAFVLGADLDQGTLDSEQIRAAVDEVVVAIEIVDSRIAGWDITLADTVADNASSGLFVLGERRLSLGDFEPVEATMEMTLNGEVVSTGNGRACLGDPLAALAWLARTAHDFGDPLRAGQVILSGALGPMVAVAPGDVVAAVVPGLGSVTARFTSVHEPDHSSYPQLSEDD